MHVLKLQKKIMNRIYPEELDKCIINVRSLRQEEAAPRAEFMEEIKFLVL